MARVRPATRELPAVVRYGLLALAPAVVVGVALLHGPSVIDDAYITFRYAHNLAAGHGLVFNPGEPLLGTSSPLMAAVLALARVLGVGIPLAARLLGMVASAGAVLAIQALALGPLGLPAAVCIGLGVALHPHMAFSANSGMETAPSMWAVYGALWSSLGGRARTAGLVSGLACLLRPDGLLVAALSGCCLWRRSGLRAVRQFGACLLLCTLPFGVYAMRTYGSALPHSVEAKRLIHPDQPAHIAQVELARLSAGTEMRVVCGLTIVGALISLLTRSELCWPLAWLLLQFAGLCAARIAPIFPWYVTPLVPGLWLFAGVSVFRTFERLPLPVPRWPLALLLSSLLLLSSFAERRPWLHTAARAGLVERAAVYMRIGAWLRPRCRPAERVLVGEAGALGYALLDQPIVDSSGINSLAIYELRKRDQALQRARGVTPIDPEGSRDWVLAALQRFEPRFVVSYLPWLHMADLLQDPRVLRDYVRLAVPEANDYVVLERRSRH